MGKPSGTATRIEAAMAVNRPPEQEAYLTESAHLAFSGAQAIGRPRRAKNLKCQSQNVFLNQWHI